MLHNGAVDVADLKLRHSKPSALQLSGAFEPAEYPSKLLMVYLDCEAV